MILHERKNSYKAEKDISRCANAVSTSSVSRNRVAGLSRGPNARKRVQREKGQ
jgi:hypothetical protein